MSLLQRLHTIYMPAMPVYHFHYAFETVDFFPGHRIRDALINGLPEEILVQIFGQLGFATCRTIIPLVCKQWLVLTEQSVDLWDTVNICGAEEEEAFRTLMRSNQTGGIKLSADSPGLRILRDPIVRWFQKHAMAVVACLAIRSSAHSSTPTAFVMDFSPRGFNSILITMRASLEHLTVENTNWIRAQPYFSDLGWLVKLKTLALLIPGEGGPTRLSSADLAGIACLKDLEELELGGDSYPVEVDSFPDAFFSLPKLDRLALGAIYVEGFADRLGRLSSLTSLVVMPFQAEGPFDLVAQQAATITGLVCLNLSHCGALTELPDLSALTRLRFLHCVRSGFTALPVQQLRSLVRIREIDFSLCEDMVVPESVVAFAEMRQLRMFSVQGCQLTSSGQRGMMCYLNAVRTRSPELSVLVHSRSEHEILMHTGKDPADLLSRELGMVLRIHM